MFCDEAIEKAYLGQPDSCSEGNYFLDCYYDMAIHITEGYREILETEHYFISIQHDGVFLIDKTGPISTIEAPDEWIEPHLRILEDAAPEDAPWVDYEWTLFVGEKLTAVTKNENGYSLKFSDFELNVIPHDADEFFHFYPHAYCKVRGTERLIKPCTCGGKGVLTIDFVENYGVRCEKCHKRTNANMCACDALAEWNEIDDLDIIEDFPEESFEKHCWEPIDYIALDQQLPSGNDSMVSCRSIIIAFRSMIYKFSCRYAGNNRYDFEILDLCSFNPNTWFDRIISTEDAPICFVRKENDGSTAILKFNIANRPFIVKAGTNTLFVSFPTTNHPTV